MHQKTILVVGGVAGGMSFATRYRRLNKEDKIIVIDKTHTFNAKILKEN